jgi:hypothetical protein
MKHLNNIQNNFWIKFTINPSIIRQLYDLAISYLFDYILDNEKKEQEDEEEEDLRNFRFK